MTKFISLFTKSKNTSNSLFIRLLEHFISTARTNYKLALVYSLGIGFIVGILFFFLILTLNLALSLFYMNTSVFSEIIINSVFYSFTTFFTVFYLCLTIVIIERISFKHMTNNKFLEDFLALAFSILFFLIYAFILTSILSLRPTFYPQGFPEYLKQESEAHKSKCDECNKNKNFLVKVQRNESTETMQLDNELSAAELESLSPEELEKLIEHLQIREFLNAKTEIAKEEMTKSFANISLYPKSNIDWNEFLNELDNMSSEREPYTSFRILHALTNGAPLNIIVEILNRGHQLNAVHITSLARRYSLDEIQKLENFGVDLLLTTHADGRGSNALIASLFNSEGPAVFEYLLTKDRLLFSEDFDVVKEVLTRSSELNRPINYAQMLIDRGAVITEDTKEWIENELRVNNPKYYSLVKSRILNN